MDTHLKTITINKIYRNTEKKDGTKYVDKNGKPFMVVVIKTTGKDGQEVGMSYCDYKGETAEYKEGDIVKLSIERNGEYLNFRPPSKVDALEERVAALEAIAVSTGVVTPNVPPSTPQPAPVASQPIAPPVPVAAPTQVPAGNAANIDKIVSSPPDPADNLPF